MAIIVNVHQAKTHLSQVLQAVLNGEEVIIAKAGKPIARLVPFVERPAQRQPGSAKGRIVIKPDFDAPLPDELRQAFGA